MDGTAAIPWDRVSITAGSAACSTCREAGDPSGPEGLSGQPGGRAVPVAPLVPLVAAVSLGIVVDRFVEPGATSRWAAAALACGVLAALLVRRRSLSSLAVLVAFGAIGGGWHHHVWSDRSRDDLSWSATETPRAAWVRGVVREAMGVRRSDSPWFGPGGGSEAGGEPVRLRTRFVVDLAAIQDRGLWRTASGRAILSVAGDRTDIRAGQAVEVIGQLSRVPGPLNPGEFDYRGFLRGQGIDLRLTVNDSEGLDRDPGGTCGAFAQGLGELRAWSRARLVDGFNAETAPLAAALLLGQREEIEPEVNDAFARTGTTHLLAVSGLQLQVLALAVGLGLRSLGLPRRPALAAVALATIGYAMLVGPAPSVVRATVMTVTFCLAALAQRAARSANTLALAALATLAVNPVYLFDVGCQLSFLAIAALVWLVPPACHRVRGTPAAIRSRLLGSSSPLDDLERRLQPWWRQGLRRAGAGMVNGVVASLVVWLAALPLVGWKFHLVAPIGILLNLPLIPMTSGALLFGVLGLVLSVVWRPLGWPASHLAGWLLEATQAVVRWGVAQPWGHRFVVGPSWGWVLVFYGLLGLATVAMSATAGSMTTTQAPPKSPPRARAGRPWLTSWVLWVVVAGWILPGWLLPGISPGPATAEAEVLAVGHGLAVIVQAPGGRTLLYDCGRLGDPAVGRRIIAPALWARGVGRIDTVLLSHADQDHYDGLPDLLDRFAVGMVGIPPGFGGPANPAAVALLDRVRSRGIPVRTIAAPSAWEFDGVRFTVQHPADGWQPWASDNARSLVLDVAHQQRHLLLTGDLEHAGLVELLGRPRPDPPPEVLLAPHHGGRSANPAELYRWARPRSVVVSQRPGTAGSADALAPLEPRGTSLRRTWREGSIRLRWTVEGIRQGGFLEPVEHRSGVTR